MNELEELKLIDVKKEAEYIEDLMDKSFNHTLKEKEIIHLMEKINKVIDKNYGHIFIEGNYKSGLNLFISNRLKEIMSIYSKNKNYVGLIEDKEYNFLREMTLYNKDVAGYANYIKVVKDIKQELSEELKYLTNLSTKKRNKDYQYNGFYSGGATHPAIEDAFEKTYVKSILSRYDNKLENYVLENIVMHSLKIIIMNNDLILKEQIKNYINNQKRDLISGVIIKDNKDLLSAPYFKLVFEILKKEEDLNSLINRYVNKEEEFANITPKVDENQTLTKKKNKL